jgi:hypothetical protein
MIAQLVRAAAAGGGADAAGVLGGSISRDTPALGVLPASMRRGCGRAGAPADRAAVRMIGETRSCRLKTASAGPRYEGQPLPPPVAAVAAASSAAASWKPVDARAADHRGLLARNNYRRKETAAELGISRVTSTTK